MEPEQPQTDSSTPQLPTPPAGWPANGTPPPPPQTQQPAATSTIPTQPQQPTVLVPERRGGLAGIVDEIRSALAPTEQDVYRDPQTGARYVEENKGTPGQQWRRIAGEAIQGAAAGLAAGKGAGNMGRAAAAGVNAGIERQAKQQQQANAQADEDYEIARQNRIDKANTYMQQLDAAQKIFQMKRLGGEYTHEQATWAQQANADEKTAGSVDLGVYGDHFSLPQVEKDHPEIKFWPTAVNGGIHVHPEVDPQTGKVTGVHLWMPVKDSQDQAVPAGTKANRVVYDAKGVPHLEQFTPTGNQTVRSIKSYNDAANNTVMAYQTAQLNNELKTQQIATAKAAASKDRALASEALTKARNEKLGLTPNGTRGGSGELDPLNPADHDRIVAGMLDGTVPIDKVFYGMRGSSMRAQYAADAKKIDRTWTWAKYDAARKVQIEFASNTPSSPGGQITSFNYMVGHAGDFMAQIDQLRNTNSPLLNQPENWLAKNMGDPAVAAIAIPMDNLRTEFEHFIKGSALTEEDRKDKMAKLNQAQTPAQMEAVAKEMLATGVVRLGGLNQGYKRTIGKDYPGLLDSQSRQILDQASSGNDFYSKQLAAEMHTWIPQPMVKLRAPNGQVRTVPQSQVKHYTQLGAVVVK